MDYNEFMYYVREGLKELIEKDSSVRIQKMLKNNDVELEALTVLSSDSRVSPTICLEPFYEEYQRGVSISVIVNEIYSLYQENASRLHFDIDIFKDYDRVKDKIVFKLINTRANKRLLRDIPHIPFLDLSIVFYWISDNEYLGVATALIRNIHINLWGITREELYETAKRNTPAILKCELREMNDLLHEILLCDIQKTICERKNEYGETEEEIDPDEVADHLMREMQEIKQQISMYVLTNRQRLNGAASLLYDNVVKDFAQMLQKDLFIIPSSVHEVILVPVLDELDRSELDEMVKTVNATDVLEVDVLSDHVYYYHRQEEKITMGEEEV